MFYNSITKLNLSLCLLTPCSYAWSPPHRAPPHPSFTHPMPSPPIATCSNPALPPGPSQWTGWGGNVYNNRWSSQNTVLNSGNINQLKQSCNIAEGAGVSATPTINGDLAYFPTWSGMLVALDYRTCRIVWQLNVTALIYKYGPFLPEQSVALPVSRTSPQIDNGTLFIGTLAHALLVAIDAYTGTVLDMINLNPHPLAVITMSPTFYDGRIFVGVASQEEAAAALVPDYKCCTFAGNMVGVDFDRVTQKLQVAWNTTMIPEADFAQGWSGAAVWGSQPSIDVVRSQLFIATGNTYTVPAAIQTCQDSTANLTSLINDPCLPPSIYQESVLALDLTSGLVNWVRQLTPLDVWTVACGVFGFYAHDPILCPGDFGPDADFGMAPTFVTGGSGSSTPNQKDTVVVGQTNGRLYALSAQAGQVMWDLQTSPGGVEGGLIWGIAVDDERIYFTAVNSDQVDFTLPSSGGAITYSAFGSASLLNGSLLWEVPAPFSSVSYAMPTVVGDLVLVATTMPLNATSAAASHGEFLALDKRTGRIVLDLAMDNVVHGGIAVQDEYVLFGTGYSSNMAPASFYVLKV